MGASIFHDIFVICLKIPNLFRRFFAEGALNQAFIPIYSEYEKAENEKKTYEFINACLLYTSPSPRDATLSRMPSSA